MLAKILFSKLTLAGVLIPLLFSSGSLADDIQRELSNRTQAQTAEIELIQAQLALANWNRSDVQSRYEQGFASWLELRRQKFHVDSIQTRLDSAVQLQQFLNEVESSLKDSGRQALIEFPKRSSAPIKVFQPGSVRVIGWIEGHSVTPPKTQTDDATLLPAAEARLAKAQQRFDLIKDSMSYSPSAKNHAELVTKAAQAEVNLLKTMQRVHPNLVSDPATATISLNELENFITATDSDELTSATARVADLEAWAGGHIETTRKQLERKKRRAEAIAKLLSEGHADAMELASVQTEVTNFQSQLESYVENQKQLTSLAADFENQVDPEPADQPSVSDWPRSVFADKEFVAHLIDLRREFYFQQANLSESRLHSEMLDEVLAKLKQARRPSGKPETQFETTLREGQQNEIQAYETDIEIAQATILSSREKQRILIAEEIRFLQQADSQYQAAKLNMASSNVSSADTIDAVGLIAAATGLVASRQPPTAARMSYVESNRIVELGHSSGFVCSHENRDYFASFSSLPDGRWMLRPGLSLSDSHSVGGLNSDRLRYEPSWMNDFRKNYQANSRSVFYDVGPLRSPYHRIAPIDSYRSPYSDSILDAYPNGILRSDLRSRVTPGQLPWYLPGSPGNIRPSQLPYPRRW